VVRHRILRRNLIVPCSSGLTLSFSFSIPSETGACSNDHKAFATGFKQMDDHKFFTKEYLNKHPFAVRSCALCYTGFDSKNFRRIWACSLAEKSNLPCMHALCDSCFGTESLNAPVEKRRTSAPASKDFGSG
jgi:hypothetical protein